MEEGRRERDQRPELEVDQSVEGDRHLRLRPQESAGDRGVVQADLDAYRTLHGHPDGVGQAQLQMQERRRVAGGGDRDRGGGDRGEQDEEREEFHRGTWGLEEENRTRVHEPGVKGSELKGACLDAIQSAGFTSRSAIFGWSNYNSRPDIRSGDDSVSDGDFVFEKNQCLNVLPWATNEEVTAGVWLGDTSAVTDNGVENLHQYPLTELHVVR